MKKQIGKEKIQFILPPLLLVIICLFYLVPLTRNGFYRSHDGEAHVARFAAYYKAYKDGQIPPRWAGDLNFRYGSPLFIFYYPLPGTIASVIHALGISLESSFKYIMVFAFVLAPLAFYAWSSLLVGRSIAFVGSLLYGFAPYHFLDLYVRGDVAEILSFVFVPLVFLYIEKSKTHSHLKYIFIGSICYALLILSHNAVSLMFSPVFLAYSFMQKKRRGVVSCILLLLAGLSLASFFWLPALVEGQFVQAKFLIGDMYRLHFPTLQQLVHSDWGFGADVYKSGGLSPQIGLLHVFLAFVSGLFILKKTKEYKIIRYWFLLFIFVLFLSLRQSDFVWQHVPLLKLFQFPWRFTALSSFIASVLGLYVLESLSNKKILIVGAGALGNFAALGSALEGIGSIDILDFDEVESTNLNRQILFYDSVGKKKASALAEKVSEIVSGINVRSIVERLDENSKYFEENRPDAILDCVDSFAVRAIVNYFAVRNNIPLISGGTNPKSGQVSVYVPNRSSCLDCKMGVEKALAEHRQAASCRYAPDPSVIMTNQIVGNMMVGETVKVLNPVGNPIKRILKYDSTVPVRGGLIGSDQSCECVKPDVEEWLKEVDKKAKPIETD